VELVLTIIPAVAGVIGVAIAAVSLYIQWQRGQIEDRAVLKVRVNPLQDHEKGGDAQLIQLFALNVGRRPVHIDGWYCALEDRAVMSSRTTATSKHRLPNVLNEQEELNITFRPEGIAWREMTHVGVHDRTNKMYEADEANVRAFKDTAERLLPGREPTADRTK
jgi:hypothetical protein